MPARRLGDGAPCSAGVRAPQDEMGELAECSRVGSVDEEELVASAKAIAERGGLDLYERRRGGRAEPREVDEEPGLGNCP